MQVAILRKPGVNVEQGSRPASRIPAEHTQGKDVPNQTDMSAGPIGIGRLVRFYQCNDKLTEYISLEASWGGLYNTEKHCVPVQRALDDILMYHWIS
jgi:hypothetical protein